MDLILLTILILGIIILSLILLSPKKEGYSIQEELKKYSYFSEVLGELCQQNKKICTDLKIKNPMERTVVFNNESFLKKLNDEFARDIQRIKETIISGKVTSSDNDRKEFEKLYLLVSDLTGYINVLCRKYSQLCTQLEIPDPLSIPLYEDNKYMKMLVNELKIHITKLRRGIEKLETEKSQNPDILYDFDE